MSAPRTPSFVWPVRVYYEDTDAGGVVYHAAYLRFMERARSEWLRHHGWTVERLRLEFGLLIVVARIEVEFLVPVRHDEALEVSAAPGARGRSWLDVAQEVRRAGGDVAARGRVRLVAVSENRFRPVPFPSVLDEVFTA